MFCLKLITKKSKQLTVDRDKLFSEEDHDVFFDLLTDSLLQMSPI